MSVLHPFAYQGCVCNFQHTPGHRKVAACAGKSLDCSLSRICPVPTCTLPSGPWIQFNSWHGPGIVPQSGLCAATLFWGLPWFPSVDAGRCVPFDFKVQEHLFVVAGSQHIPPHASVPVSYSVALAVSNLSYCNRPLFALSPNDFQKPPAGQDHVCAQV